MENSLQMHSQYTRLLGEANGTKKLSDMILNMKSLSKKLLFSFNYIIYPGICQHCNDIFLYNCNSSAFWLPCYGICPFQVACGEGQIPSWLYLHVLTDFAVNAKSWAELLRLIDQLKGI